MRIFILAIKHKIVRKNAEGQKIKTEYTDFLKGTDQYILIQTYE